MLLADQLKYKILPNYFEEDYHSEKRELDIDKFKILYSESFTQNILIVTYKSSPFITLYNHRGKIIDLDHYLPDEYKETDKITADRVINNIEGINIKALKDPKKFKSLLSEVIQSSSIEKGIMQKYGLFISNNTILNSFSIAPIEEGDQVKEILKKFNSFADFLEAVVTQQQLESTGYVHFTSENNIIITTLNIRSGIALFIETKDVKGRLLHPDKWNIVRTHDPHELKQNLVFRSHDIKEFFNENTKATTLETDRYLLEINKDQLLFDSKLDSTSNKLSINIINESYHFLCTDNNIIVALSEKQTVSLINTYNSIIPNSWISKMKFEEDLVWVKSDENLNFFFIQNTEGNIKLICFSTGIAETIYDFGKFEEKFEIDQNGSLIVRSSESGKLQLINTNIYDLEIIDQEKNFNTIFKSLTHLFKGESLFTDTTYATVITKKTEQEKVPKIITIIDKARAAFETNIDYMITESIDDYKKLVKVREKIAVARQNIQTQLLNEAQKLKINLRGQKLKISLNNIVNPSEKKLDNLIEKVRAKYIVEELKLMTRNLDQIINQENYQDILNKLRRYDDELKSMKPENTMPVIKNFIEIQKQLNNSFSSQISQDSSTLHAFINGEIEIIEDAVQSTFDPKKLEAILSIHPASIELMSLLKQPFILQSIAKERKLSPSGIQSRLFKAVEDRRKQLNVEEKRITLEKNAAKQQLIEMTSASIHFFVKNHSDVFSDIVLKENPAYQTLLTDIITIENGYNDIKAGTELRRTLERKILERNRDDLEKLVSFEGKYAFIQNDPDLFIDNDITVRTYPNWDLKLAQSNGELYSVSFIRNTDREIFIPSIIENLKHEKAFEIESTEFKHFNEMFSEYSKMEYTFSLLSAVKSIESKKSKTKDHPEFNATFLNDSIPTSKTAYKALICALLKKQKEHHEKYRIRQIPNIDPTFIDETPYFQSKLNEFIIKAKLQLMSGSGVLLLSGPPSTGKSAFLKFVAALMNREYFEHAADKWQTKNSLVTSIKFGDNGPYTIPSGFTKAITTPYSLINIEEIKEWPEALRKSLNPFFAGSKAFIAPDGTSYDIGENILLCAAANLGSIYRQDDEPFTADFWSRIEVVEYDYAPYHIDRSYFNDLHNPQNERLITIQDLVKKYFNYELRPKDPIKKAAFFSKQFLEFILLPKSDEKIKKENLSRFIEEYFLSMKKSKELTIGPEEAAKIAIRRMKEFHRFSTKEFFDIYDHIVNNSKLKSIKLSKLKIDDVEEYEQLRVLVLCLRDIEGCLRYLRQQFYTSAGQTEIEGTNREFIKAVYLLNLMGKL